jgi:hypothetical protein
MSDKAGGSVGFEFARRMGDKARGEYSKGGV